MEEVKKEAKKFSLKHQLECSNKNRQFNIYSKKLKNQIIFKKIKTIMTSVLFENFVYLYLSAEQKFVYFNFLFTDKIQQKVAESD